MTTPTPHSHERRKSMFTQQDLEALAEVLKNSSHSACALNINPQVAQMLNQITPEQLGILRRIMIICGNAASTLGMIFVVIFALASMVLMLAVRGSWQMVAELFKKQAGS